MYSIFLLFQHIYLVNDVYKAEGFGVLALSFSTTLLLLLLLEICARPSEYTPRADVKIYQLFIKQEMCFYPWSCAVYQFSSHTCTVRVCVCVCVHLSAQQQEMGESTCSACHGKQWRLPPMQMKGEECRAGFIRLLSSVHTHTHILLYTHAHTVCGSGTPVTSPKSSPISRRELKSSLNCLLDQLSAASARPDW